MKKKKIQIKMNQNILNNLNLNYEEIFQIAVSVLENIIPLHQIYGDVSSKDNLGIISISEAYISKSIFLCEKYQDKIEKYTEELVSIFDISEEGSLLEKELSEVFKLSYVINYIANFEKGEDKQDILRTASSWDRYTQIKNKERQKYLIMV